MRKLMQEYLEEKDNSAATNQQPRPRPPRKDGSLTNDKRQGHFIPPSKRPQQPMLHDPKLAQHITMDTTSRDPDWDIEPTGSFQIYARPPDSETDTPLALVYSPLGQLLGKLTVARVQMLQAAFEYTKQTRPEIHENLKVQSFEQEVAFFLLFFLSKR